MSGFSLTAVLRDVVLPYLTELRERGESGTASVALEHFASSIIRGRLAGLARGCGNGHGPRAVLAWPPGELRDLALMVFGIVLNRNGWRIDYLGMSTPVEELTRTVDTRHPDLVGLAATLTGNLEPLATQLTRSPGAPARPGRSRRHAAGRDLRGARLLTGEPVTEAETLSGRGEGARGRRLGFVDSRPCPALAETGHDAAATTRHPGYYNAASRPSTVTCMTRPPSARLSPAARRPATACTR